MNAALNPWKKTVNVVWTKGGKTGMLSLTPGLKGKVKVAGTAPDGAKANGNPSGRPAFAAARLRFCTIFGII